MQPFGTLLGSDLLLAYELGKQEASNESKPGSCMERILVDWGKVKLR